MVLFSEVVNIKRSSCKKCLALVYTIPCRLDENIADYMKGFGVPTYPLKAIKLLRIDTKDGYKIEGKMGKNTIKFAIPKHLEEKNLDKSSRKLEFEGYLKRWMTDKLDITME